MGTDSNTEPGLQDNRQGTGPVAGSLLSVLIVGVFALTLSGTSPLDPPVIVPLLLLASVLIGAARFGVWPGIAAAVAAFAAYNFLFVEPYYTLRVAHFADIVTLSVFLLTASLTGWLAGRLRDEADSARRRMDHLNHLASLTETLARARTSGEALQGLVRHVHGLSRCLAVILSDSDGRMSHGEVLPAGARVDDESLPIAARAFTYNAIQPPAAYGSSGRQFAFYPAGRSGETKHVLAAGFNDAMRRHAGEFDHAMRQMAAQTMEALERIQRSAEAGEARRFAETERLRSGLLLSLSHDLRTPLAGILGAVSSLREPSLKLTATAKADLLLTAEEETRRLSRYVDDLLTLTRLQAGLKPELIVADANEIAGLAVKRARSVHHDQHFGTLFADSATPLKTDPALAEQVIFNLLDNAAKHAPAGSAVQIAVSRAEGDVRISVSDDGPGIDPQVAANIFDPLFRGRDSAGAGLGLAIVKSAVTVLGGKVELVSPVSEVGGTTFVVTLPGQT